MRNENLKKLHESKTWIEQVKGQAMAGATLTDDFWANDILWQLSVFVYNLPAGKAGFTGSSRRHKNKERG